MSTQGFSCKPTWAMLLDFYSIAPSGNEKLEHRSTSRAYDISLRNLCRAAGTRIDFLRGLQACTADVAMTIAIDGWSHTLRTFALRFRNIHGHLSG